MNIVPLADKVLIIEDKAEEKTGNILLPDQAKEKPKTGTIHSVGPGKILENGVFQETKLRSGDRVVFSPYSGGEITFEGQKYLVMCEDEVVARLVS